MMGTVKNAALVVAGAAAVFVGEALAPSTKQLAKAVGKPCPERAPAPAAGAAASPDKWQGKPMSAWRKAYIAKHGREPPARSSH
jgi:hypothetical protein